MIAQLTTVGGAAALVATLNACTVAAPSPAPASNVEHAPTSAVAAATTMPMSEPQSADVSPTITASRPAVTVVIAVPPMPAHLTALRPSGDTVGPDDHDHDSEPPLDDAALAVAWLAAVYTGRYDQPDANVDVAAGLTDDPALTTGALAALPALDVERLEVRWPIVVDVADQGDGWWQLTFVLKHTAAGQVGPATSGPYTARVHLADGRVDGWEPPA